MVVLLKTSFTLTEKNVERVCLMGFNLLEVKRVCIGVCVCVFVGADIAFRKNLGDSQPKLDVLN